MVDRDRGDAAPVVDPRIEEQRKVVIGEVRWRLHVPVGAEQHPRRRDRPELLVERRIGMVGHPRVRLGAEVLDDHLADVPVLVVERPQGEQGVEPLVPGLADADQDAARERDRELAGQPDRLEPHGGHLVRRRPVRPALQREPVGDRLEHDPHRRRHRAQQLELVPAHHARVQVREHPRLVEHAAGTVREVLDRRREAELRELLTSDPVAQLGLVAEGEQRFRAARRGSGPGDLEHLVDRTGRLAHHGAAVARTCSSRRHRGTASSAG